MPLQTTHTVRVRDYTDPARRDADLRKLGRRGVRALALDTREGLHRLMVRPSDGPHARILLGLPEGEYHHRDEDCAPDEDLVCTGCGVVFGPPCEACRARAYHRDGCALGASGSATFECHACDGEVACNLRHSGGVANAPEVEVEDIPEACPYCDAPIDWRAAEAAVLDQWWG